MHVPLKRSRAKGKYETGVGRNEACAKDLRLEAEGLVLASLSTVMIVYPVAHEQCTREHGRSCRTMRRCSKSKIPNGACRFVGFAGCTSSGFIWSPSSCV